MDLELQGRGALVVGATGDIGRAVVERLSSEGARVVAGARSTEGLDGAFGAASGGIAGFVEIDMIDDASIASAASRAEEILGGIDVLVCTAAGEVNYGGVWGVDRGDWESELAIKCIGTSRLCTAVAKGMVERKRGVIVNVIGIATDIVVRQNPVGSGTNSALRSFTRVLAAEVAEAGVRVVGVSPGMVAGQRFDRFAGDRTQEIQATIPLGYIGSPQEIADVIVFFASDRATYVTGVIVNVDGGVTLVR
jgi:NAD(P)-dependent dehydrogenase (short-subunit alcohol dehydrogenase family)